MYIVYIHNRLFKRSILFYLNPLVRTFVAPWPRFLKLDKSKEDTGKGKSVNNVQYRQYLKSAKWSNIRSDMLRYAKHQCQKCGAKNCILQVHHIDYENLYDEMPEDLEVLCKSCHQLADQDREYETGFDTFFEKKYGSSSLRASRSDYQEFDNWIKKQDYEY